MSKKIIKQILPLILLIVIPVLYNGCKKIDLERIAAIKTQPVTNITTNSVSASGEIIDIGEGSVNAYGFCFGTTNDPIFNVNSTNLGNVSKTGSFTANISGLLGNTKYYLRTFIRDDSGITYGNTVSFTTGGTSYSFRWDDGINFDGIGFTDGSDFDYAIRIPTQQLTPYNGYRISKVRFFPKANATYYVEVYDGINGSNLVFYENVLNPTINAWTEYSPTYNYYINSTVEVWVGIWVTDYIAGNYPAGVDDGPAITGFGDMFSLDNGITWESLFLTNDLDYNWNLEVFFTNKKGEEIKYNACNPIVQKEKPISAISPSGSKPVANNKKSN
jgi:hypothetical protein